MKKGILFSSVNESENSSRKSSQHTDGTRSRSNNQSLSSSNQISRIITSATRSEHNTPDRAPVEECWYTSQNNNTFVDQSNRQSDEFSETGIQSQQRTITPDELRLFLIILR